MTGAPPPIPPSGSIADTTPPNPVPFLIALAGFLVLAVLAFVYLREDRSSELVRPDRLSVVDDDTIRAVALERSPCERITRVQVDLAEDAIFVEFVVEERGGACTEVLAPLEAEVTLPEPVDDRDLRPGVGRLQIPCTESAASVTCTADR